MGQEKILEKNQIYCFEWLHKNKIDHVNRYIAPIISHMGISRYPDCQGQNFTYLNVVVQQEKIILRKIN